MDRAVTAMFDRILEEPPTDPQEIATLAGTFDSIEGMVVHAATSTAELKHLSDQLAKMARMTRALRPISRDLQRGLRGFVDAQATYDEWVRRIPALRDRLGLTSQGSASKSLPNADSNGGSEHPATEENPA